jgi:hypothetical protein
MMAECATLPKRHIHTKKTGVQVYLSFDNRALDKPFIELSREAHGARRV